jgi:hypothetical protein
MMAMAPCRTARLMWLAGISFSLVISNMPVRRFHVNIESHSCFITADDTDSSKIHASIS